MFDLCRKVKKSKKPDYIEGYLDGVMDVYNELKRRDTCSTDPALNRK